MDLFTTTGGTTRYKEKFEGALEPRHFRRSQNLWFSSIGFGTYLGEADEATDELYLQAILQAVSSGCNVVDTAINYRHQRSERTLGKALKLLFLKGFSRDELIISTKGGFIPFDHNTPDDPRTYLEETFLKPGIMTLEDIITNCHCMTPAYLEHQLNGSLQNLGLDCIDIYFLHNPETQLEGVNRQEFNRRIEAAFTFLEEKVRDGQIRFYGTATWEGYRNHPDHPAHLELQELLVIARSVGGEGHHFRMVQLPHNLAMPEAITHSNQRFGGQFLSLLETAAQLGVTVYASASLHQGRTTRNLPQSLRDPFGPLETDAQRSLQFVRSTPGLVTALVGMKQEKHVAENLSLAKQPPLTREQFFGLFTEETK